MDSRILILFMIIGSVLAVEYAPTVQLKNGKVRGIVQEVVDVGNIYSYQGIRYGKSVYIYNI